MVRVTFVEPGGAARSEELPEGWTLMQAAVARGVEGIVADCGGSCSCGTCHVYVDPADLARLPPPDTTECAVLSTVAAQLRAQSRLACQITLTAELDGITVRVPKTQY